MATSTEQRSELLGGWRFYVGVSFGFVAVSVVGLGIPAIISTLVTALSLQPDAAGWLGSATLWGLAIGAIIAYPLAGRVPVRGTVALLVGFCGVVELLCIFTQEFVVLFVLQMIVGAAAGMSASLFGSLFARAENVEKLAGISAAVQAGSTALVFVVLPWVSSKAGMTGAWLFLGGFVIISALVILAILPRIDKVEITESTVTRTGDVPQPLGLPAVLAVLSIFVFFIGSNSIYSYRILQGMQNADLSYDTANMISSVTVLVSIGAGLLAAKIGNRLGRALPVIASATILTAAILMMLGTSTELVFWISTAMFQFGVTYVVIPWQEFQAALDPRGRPLVAATFTGYLGVALGGTTGALFVGQGSGADGYIDYTPLTIFSSSAVVVGVLLLLLGIKLWKGRRAVETIVLDSAQRENDHSTTAAV